MSLQLADDSSFASEPPYSLPPSPTVTDSNSMDLNEVVRTPSPKAVIFRLQKRGIDEIRSTSVLSSPIQKKPNIETKTAITTALAEGSSTGLMKFFKKCTQDEYDLQVQRFTKEANTEAEAEASRLEAINCIEEKRMRERARLRKQKSRKRKLDDEIMAGERMPGGKKRKVSPLIYLLFVSLILV